jgi:ketosteroid isomerase-like protein
MTHSTLPLTWSCVVPMSVQCPIVAREHDCVMATDANEAAIRAAYAAYASGDIEALLAVFSPELEWTYLDPSVENPAPHVCHGLVEMRRALRRQSDQGLKASIEEVRVHGSDVVAVIHIPGLDQIRGRKSDDRNYEVFSFRDGQIVALRACVDLAEALRVAGLA